MSGEVSEGRKIGQRLWRLRATLKGGYLNICYTQPVSSLTLHPAIIESLAFDGTREQPPGVISVSALVVARDEGSNDCDDKDGHRTDRQPSWVCPASMSASLSPPFTTSTLKTDDSKSHLAKRREEFSSCIVRMLC